MIEVKVIPDPAFLDLAERLKVGLLPVIDKETRLTTGYAKRLIIRSTARGRTGLTQGMWKTEKITEGVYRIYNLFKHVAFLEYGTGIYGPFKRWIRPKTAMFLHFPIWSANTITGWVRTLKVAGMPKQPMIAPNKDKIINDLRIRISNAIKRLTAATGGK
ncbi:MAG: hypothetical protein WC734_05885 [Patescibacteria group bacterium]|jgi:hypothetical protein